MRPLKAVIALAAAAITGCSSDSVPPSPSPSVHHSTGSAQRIDAHGPVGLTVVGATVWTVEAAAGAIVARDARTSRVLHRVHVGDTPLRAAYDGTSVWVSVFGAGKVVAVDPSSGRILRRVRVPGQPEGIIAAFGAIWVVRQAARKLTRIGSDGTLGPSYRLGAEPRLIAAGGSDLFVADVTDGTITRVDPHTGKRTLSGKVCDGAQDLAAAGGTLWVACTRSNRLVAVDERTLRATATLHVSGEPDGERVVDGKLYVVATSGPTIYQIRIGPHPTVVDKRVLGKAFPLDDRANVDVVIVSGRIWVSSYGEGKVLNVPA